MHTDLNKTKLILGYILLVLVLIFVWSELLMGADYMYWDAPKKFATIALANITNQGDRPEASQPLVLYTNGDAEISADTGTAAQLKSASNDTLVTEYRLTFSGDGTTKTGAAATSYQSYEQFLTPLHSVVITHVADYNDVTVTLHVRASNYANDLADAGTYTATQTLTVHWVGP